MVTLVLNFRLFVTAKCGLAEYTGAEVKVNPKSRFAQYPNKKLSAHPTTLSFTSPHTCDYQRWLSPRPQRLNS